MGGPMDSAEEAGLWRRWREAGGGRLAAGAEPDALELAAYAENRLSPEETEAVEDWLSSNPQIIKDIFAAREIDESALPEAPEAVVARAAALVGVGDGKVLAFRRPTASRRRWRGAASWGAMAASLLVASLAGFAMGDDTYATLLGGSPPVLGQELLDPPSSLFNGIDEDSNI